MESRPSSSWRRTHTNQYLSFDSHHPSNHKSAVVHTLLKWADRLSSSLVDCSEEEQHVMKALVENGYLKHFTRRLCNRHHNPSDSQPEPTAVAVLLYIQGLSNSIKTILQKDFGIKTIFRSAGSLKHILSCPKDPLPVLLRGGVVYKIPCKDCDKSYIENVE